MQVNFSGGVDNFIINVSIEDDDILEGYEKFNVSIHNFTMHGVVVLGEIVTAEVIVLDNERKCTYNNNCKY